MTTTSDPAGREILRSIVVTLRRCLGELEPAAAYAWANRLLALRCLEARELIDEVIVQRDVYGGRSLVHHRFAQRHPEGCLGDDDGLYTVLEETFAEQARRLPLLFGDDAATGSLRPSSAAVGQCIRALSGAGPGRPGDAATRAIFAAPDALGWAYQYWQAEQRHDVLERLRADRRFKIEGEHLIAATQLYTEPYMVEFLVDNTLEAMWTAAHPDLPLGPSGPRLLRDAPLPKAAPKPVEQITVLDPACGSGHFLLGAFDALYAMYERQGTPARPEDICRAIIERNLFGIDLDPRAVQLAEAALWMKAADRCGSFGVARANLVAPQSGAELPDLTGGSAQPSSERTAPTFSGDARAGWSHAAELGSLLRAPPQMIRAADSGRPDSGTAGADLLTMLRRRYDVVLANPPYVDKRNQGAVLRAFLRAQYPTAKGNTYAAFILRALELARVAVGMVTPQAFLFVRSYSGLREQLASSCTVASLAQLGSGAFRDAGVDPALFVLHPESDPSRLRLAGGVYLDLTDLRDKAAALAQVTRGDPETDGAGAPRRYLRSRAELEVVPGAPMAFRLGPGSLSCFAALEPLSHHADVVLGMKTSDNRRFLRRWWELDGTATQIEQRGFAPYEKQASGSRFGGAAGHWVRWNEATQGFYGSAYSAQLPNERYWFRSGIAYGLVSHDFTAKVLRSGHLADMAASCVFPHDQRLVMPLLGLLNSTVARWWLNVLNPTVNFQPVDLQRLPVPAWGSRDRRRVGRAVARAVGAMDALRAELPTDRGFVAQDAGVDLAQWAQRRILREIEHGVRFLLARDAADQVMVELYDLPPEELGVMHQEIGGPVTSLPLVVGYDRGLPGLPLSHGAERVPAEALGSRLTRRLSGDLAPPSDSDRGRPSAGATRAASSARPRRADLLSEQLCHELGVHPVSLYRLLQEALERKRWRWPSEERRVVADQLTARVLGLLADGWPAASRARASAPVVSPASRIFVVSLPTEATPLRQQVCDVLAEAFPSAAPELLEQQCSVALGQPIGSWLARELFPRHIKQFGRRPVLWQLSSRPQHPRQPAAFSCLVHGPRVDGDTLAKIRSQHLRPALRALATERDRPEALAGGFDPVPDAPSRRLDGWIREIEDFDQRLAQVDSGGFACIELDDLGAQEPLDRFAAHSASAKPPRDRAAWLRQERRYAPSSDDGVRVNIAPLQRAGLLAHDVLAKTDVERAIVERARWRAAERAWCREGKQQRPSWWRGSGGASTKKALR